jgi:hypothetical protein
MVSLLEMTRQGGDRIDVTGYVRTNKAYFHSLYTLVIACDGLLPVLRSTQAAFHAYALGVHLIGRDVEEMLWIGGTVRHAASEGLAAMNQRNA